MNARDSGTTTIEMHQLKDSTPENHAVLIMQSGSPMMRGHGTVNYACPVCKTIIFESVTPRYYAKLAVKCGGCLSVSVVPPCPSVLF